MGVGFRQWRCPDADNTARCSPASKNRGCSARTADIPKAPQRTGADFDVQPSRAGLLHRPKGPEPEDPTATIVGIDRGQRFHEAFDPGKGVNHRRLGVQLGKVWSFEDQEQPIPAGETPGEQGTIGLVPNDPGLPRMRLQALAEQDHRGHGPKAFGPIAFAPVFAFPSGGFPEPVIGLPEGVARGSFKARPALFGEQGGQGNAGLLGFPKGLPGALRILEIFGAPGNGACAPDHRRLGVHNDGFDGAGLLGEHIQGFVEGPAGIFFAPNPRRRLLEGVREGEDQQFQPIPKLPRIRGRVVEDHNHPVAILEVAPDRIGLGLPAPKLKAGVVGPKFPANQGEQSKHVFHGGRAYQHPGDFRQGAAFAVCSVLALRLKTQYPNAMALNEDAVGKTTEELVHEYSWKDVALYALGVGATVDELDFLYEKRGPKVLPTYAVVPTFPVCEALFEVTGGDLLGVVHGAQSITLHKPFAPEGKLRTIGKVAGVYDMKRFGQALFSTETRDEQGDLIAETEWQIIFRNDGGYGGTRPPKTERFKAPARDADFVVSEKTSPEQALLYRLNGDFNPLHADPEIGEKAGFGKPILHGLCTFGYVGRAIVNQACGGDPSRLKKLSGQFRRPVWPGDTLVTSGWKEEDRVIVRLSTEERPDEQAFANAYAIVE